MNTLNANWKPSVATQAQTQPRVRTAQFGDGYDQEVLDGLNAYLRVWNVIWQPIHHSGGDPNQPTLKTLDDFFRANAGLRFLWTQPPPFDVEGAKVFRCKDWSWTYDRGLIVGVRATLGQRPEV